MTAHMKVRISDVLVPRSKRPADGDQAVTDGKTKG